MFKYEFMQIAFAVGLMFAVIIPLIGVTVVLKRLSMTGDALSHTSLAGVAIGLIFGFNPLVIAMITCVIAAFVIEFIRKKFNKYSELAIAIVLSAGIGLAGVLSSFASSSNFNSYLFGSIVAITKLELFLTLGLFIVVILAAIFFYKDLMYISYNEKSARISKVPVSTVNVIFTILTAITVALASKIIGALIVSSLMVVPVAASMQIAKSYKQTILYSVLVAIVSVILGLVLSYYEGLKPGGTIVLICIFFLLIFMLAKFIIKQINKKHEHRHKNKIIQK